MSLANLLISKLWRIPSSSRGLTLEGIALSERPPLTEESTRFAVFADPRFYKLHSFERLVPFLPEKFEVIEGPNGQNCYMYCLNIQRNKFGRKDFDLELEKRGYRYYNYSADSIEIGDIIVYSIPGLIDSIRQHAGVYVGDGRVQSRWGQNSPLIEHPLEVVPPNYWNKDERYLTIERKGR